MQVEITITNPAGLHARPAAEFVKRAKASASKITVTSGDKTVDAKSMLGILKLGATQGTTISVEVDGDDADQVIADFTALLSVEG
ncbi:MAG: HPr family phosphocarrier protein [Acidimicrobiia bacterium]|nr:HPr family phosphocarrier protein [Acidimicrobiia bacterium]MYA38109.1 HPr family phosphocarrier protein [Acidimicrobiia bacterium]MYB79800.1 HPr family phosphocarrier protein [Acidimicrobiia bacterium]MYK56180.1 HPr family phosphocarrier protein [Acidimicrobiia bacterium]